MIHVRNSVWAKIKCVQINTYIYIYLMRLLIESNILPLYIICIHVLWVCTVRIFIYLTSLRSLSLFLELTVCLRVQSFVACMKDCLYVYLNHSIQFYFFIMTKFFFSSNDRTNKIWYHKTNLWAASQLNVERKNMIISIWWQIIAILSYLKWLYKYKICKYSYEFERGLLWIDFIHYDGINS